MGRECPAKGKRCDNCKLIGHFRRVCRRVSEIHNDEPDTYDETAYERATKSSEEDYNEVEYLYMIDEEGIDVSMITDPTAVTEADLGTKDGKWKTFDVLMDTGAKISVLYIKDFESLGMDKKDLFGPKIPIRGFGKGAA